VPDVRTLYQQFRVMGVPRGEALNGNGHHVDEDDPLAAALLRQRAVQASRIDDGAARMVEAQADLDRRRLEVEAEKLELERTEAQAKLQVIRADLRKLAENGDGPRAPDAGMQALLLFVQQNQEQATKDRETLLGLLNEQLEASRAAQATSPEPAPSPTIAEQIQTLVGLRAAMAELFPPPPPAPGVNPHQMIELRKMELDVEFQRARLAEEARARTVEADRKEREMLANLDVRQQQVQAEVQRNEQMAGLIERLGPAALAAFTQRFSGGDGAQGGADPAPAQGGGQDMQQHVQLSCPSCHQPFLATPGTTAAACPHCHAYLDLKSVWQRGAGQHGGG
jgi:hypothetical protein